MFEEFIDKKVQITIGREGEETHHNLTLKEAEGTLIKVEDYSGKVKVINRASSNFFEIQLMK